MASSLISTLPFIALKQEGINVSGLGIFGTLFDGIAKSISDFGKWLSDSIMGAFNFIKSGFESIGSALYSFGQWLYNGLSKIIGDIVNTIVNIIKAIVYFLQQIYNGIKSGVDFIVYTFNNTINNLVTRFRNKLIDIIRFNVMFILTDRLIKKEIESDKPFIKRISGFVLGMFANLLISETLARVIDAILPHTPPVNFNLFQFSLPSVDFITPTNELVSKVSQIAQVEKPYPYYGITNILPLHDYIFVDDTLVTPFFITQLYSDEITVYDVLSFTALPPGTYEDSISIIDNVTFYVSASRNYLDSVSVSDSVNVTKPSAPSFSDSVSVTDSMTTAITHAPSFTDSVGVSDTISVTI